MRLKLIAILAFGALVIAGATAIGIANIKTLDRTFFLAENVQNEAGLVKQSASLLTQRYADSLSRLASELRGSDPQSGATKRALGASEFFMLATLEENPGKGWIVTSSYRNGARNVGWTVQEEPKMLKVLPTAAVTFEKSVWFRHLAKSGHPLYVLLVKVKIDQGSELGIDEAPTGSTAEKRNAILVGVLSNQAFASAIQSFKGTDREVIVLDDRGYALGYTRQQYLGAPIKHPLVKKLKAERKLFDSGEFKNARERKVVGAYARLEDSNLYAIVTRPIEGLPSLVSTTFMQLASFTFAGLAFCFLMVFVVFRSQIASFEYLQDFVISMAQGLPVRAPENYSNLPGILMESVEKLRADGVPTIRVAPEMTPADESVAFEAEEPTEEPVDSRPSEVSLSELTEGESYQKAIRELVNNFKRPLGSILGQTQLAKSKTESDELNEHHQVIEREARKIRETLEELIGSSEDSQGLGGSSSSEEAESFSVSESSMDLSLILETETESSEDDGAQSNWEPLPMGSSEDHTAAVKATETQVQQSPALEVQEEISEVQFEELDTQNFIEDVISEAVLEQLDEQNYQTDPRDPNAGVEAEVLAVSDSQVAFSKEDVSQKAGSEEAPQASEDFVPDRDLELLSSSESEPEDEFEDDDLPMIAIRKPKVGGRS